MNIRTTLMLMAATVAGPLTAQPPAEYYTALTAPAAVVNATVEQRAEAMPALALMPADCDYSFSITDIPGLINSLRQAGAIDDLTYEQEIPAEVKQIRSIAIAGDKGSNAMVNTLVAWYNYFTTDDYLKNLSVTASMASEQYVDTLYQIITTALQENSQEFDKTLSNIKIAPTYGALVLNPGNEALAQAWYSGMLNFLQAATQSSKEMEFVSINGFSGIKVAFPAAPETVENEQKLDLLKKEFANRAIYILFRAEGNAIVASICEDPAQIALAATPQESILATDKLATVDSKIGNGLFMTTYVSAEIMRNYMTIGSYSINKTGQTISKMFNALAAKGDANQEVFTKAAQGIDAIAAAWINLYDSTADQPLCLSASWTGNIIDVDITADNFGYNFKPAELRLTDKAADPNTIYYCEGAYFESNRWPNLGDMIEAALAVTEGCTAASSTQCQTGSCSGLDIAKNYMPEIKECLGAFSTIGSGLDNTMAFIIDKGATMPAILGGEKGNTTAFPRVAFYSGVSDRSKLGEGWETLRQVAGKALVKAGQNPTYVNMLPILPRKEGDGMKYSISLPWFTKDFIPTLAVNDSTFVIGSSETLNAEIMQTATGSMQLPGMVATINFKPLAEMMQSIADDMLARLPEPQPISVSVDCTGADTTVAPVAVEPAVEEEEEEMIEEDAGVYIMEMDEEYDECYNEELSEEQVRAETFASIAAVTKGIAEVVDSLHFTCVTEKDTARTRIQIKLNK